MTYNDTISRQEVLNYIDNMPSELTADGRRMIRQINLIEYIQDLLPSAQKTGRWMKYKTLSRKDGERAMIEAPHNKMFCSSCGKHEYPTEFCPHCGAKMKGEEDERGSKTDT